ncbi:MAG: phosphotransferase [Micropruina sp.]|uniref:phosphotransferase enzyme family protein n=1 Tax=Micropruina sp. TaxID=2737536 RepID=UPI0039E3FB8E
MRKSFAEVTARTQVQRLRALAARALPVWGIGDARLRLLHHGYNSTFRVDTADGGRFALRVNTQPHKTDAQLAAEVAWLAALAADTGLRVPTPQRTLDGRWSARIPSADHDRELPVVLFSWLDGRNLGERPTQRQLRAVGEAMAVLHRHAEAWRLPAGAELPLFDDVLTDLPNRLGDHPALDAEAREVLSAAYRRAQRLQDEAFADTPVIPLHADLHGGNLKWHAGRLSVFDFDDAGLGVPALDLAIAVYYLRDDAAAEQALTQGYAAVRPLPPVRPEVFEAMVAGRNLLLVNDLIEQPNADLRSLVPGYVRTSVARLRAWLETGRFRREVPGATS